MLIAIHSIVAFACIPLGAWLLFNTKGTERHKRFGQTYIGLMLIVVLTAIFIRELNSGRLSWVHLLVPWTLFWIVFAIYSIKKYQTTGNLRWRRSHQNSMIGLYVYVGALLLAGALTLLPGRMFHNFLFT